MLVKPQFELNFGQVGKGGIVREAALYEQVEKRVREAYVEQGLTVHAWLESPIQGGDGNREFFIHASKAGSKAK
jgi:23S rRNA (cytidine1920-2'-O)/16S rRNA (cytidine1409-2'-O)-methyltransferase